MAIFEGAGVALITPFHEDKSVNYKMLGTLLERQISNKTDAIINLSNDYPSIDKKSNIYLLKFVIDI